MTADRSRVSFGVDRHVLESVGMAVQRCEIHKTTELYTLVKMVNFMLCEFYLSKTYRSQKKC